MTSPTWLYHPQEAPMGRLFPTIPEPIPEGWTDSPAHFSRPTVVPDPTPVPSDSSPTPRGRRR